MSYPADRESLATNSTENLDSSWQCTPAQRRFVLVAAILASALGFIDGSIVSIAMPSIRIDLGATLSQAQWISNGYALTLSALLLAGGAAGDNFGLRKVFVLGIAAFVLASVACALAPTPFALIVARAIQGIGAAVMVPCSLAIIAKAFPRKERGRAIGIWAASSALTTAMGPVLGGLVLSLLGSPAWRLIFAINVPLGGVAIYMLLAKVPVDSGRRRTTLDLGGAALATLSLGLLAYGLTDLNGEGGHLNRGIGAAITGLVTAGLFVWWESRHANPMVDLGLFKNAAFSGANAATFLIYFALSAILFYLPMLLIAGWGIGAATSGFIFLPLSGAIALLSGPIGAFSDRVGPKLPIAAGCLFIALAYSGLAILTGAGLHHFWTGIFPLMCVMGIGMALVVSPLSTAIMMAVDDHDSGAASGINNSVSRIGGLFAVAAMGALASLRYGLIIGATGEGGSIPGFGEPSVGCLAPALEAARIAASDSAFSSVAWVTAALCAVAAIVTWTTVGGNAEKAG